MPYVTGESLRARLSNGGELPVDEAVGILKEVARALAYAHEQGVIHRDIKPDNVLLSGGSAMVTDFGVAKAVSAATTEGGRGMTGTGISVGTPAYMSPEQATADPRVDHRADIYAFGCLAYELLTGTPLFAGRSPQAMIAAHITESPEPLERRRASVPQPLAALVARCLAKNPADRPQRATELVQALEQVSSASSAASPAMSARTKRVPIAIVATVIVVVGLAVSLVPFARRPRLKALSVAVLPMENVGGDSTQAYFANGISEDIASALVSDGIRVAPMSSAASPLLTQAGVNTDSICRLLGVDAVVTGKASRLRDQLRVTVTLARPDSVMWQHSYAPSTSNVLAVQGIITDSIIDAVRTRLNVSATRGKRRAEDPVAHDLVMRAKFLTSLSTRESIRRAIALYHQALARDTANVAAYVGLSFAWQSMADGYAPPVEVIPQATAAANHALALDSTLAEAWSIQALLNVQYLRDYPWARYAIDRALALNPNDILGRVAESVYWITQGRHDRLVQPAREAARLDPLSVFSALSLQWMFYLAGQSDSAIAQTANLERLAPGFAYLDAFEGYALADLGRYAQAESTFRRAEPALQHRSPGLAGLLASRGRAEEARAILREIERDWSKKYVMPEFIAFAYLALGDKERTYAWLERGVEVRSAGAVFSALWPSLRPIRGEPRFRSILRRLNIPDAASP
jgi:serine/threonine-protein kinase